MMGMSLEQLHVFLLACQNYRAKYLSQLKVLGAKLLGVKVLGVKVLGVIVLGVKVLRGEVLGVIVLGVKVLGVKVLGVKILGAKVLGMKVLGVKVLGAKVLGVKVVETGVVEESKALILHACSSVPVFNEMRNCVMCKKVSVQIWNASCEFKRHQFAPTLDLLVTVKVKLVQIRKIRMTGDSQK